MTNSVYTPDNQECPTIFNTEAARILYEDICKPENKGVVLYDNLAAFLNKYKIQNEMTEQEMMHKILIPAIAEIMDTGIAKSIGITTIEDEQNDLTTGFVISYTLA